MDVTNIASLATSMTTAARNQAVDTAVLKKALDIQSSGAMALIDALPPVSAPKLPAHLGQNINTTA